MLLFLQILFGVLAAGTGIGLIVDIGKNRMDELKNAYRQTVGHPVSL